MVNWPPDFFAVALVWIRPARLIAIVRVGVKISIKPFWLEMIYGPRITMLLNRDRLNSQGNVLKTIKSRLINKNPFTLSHITHRIILFLLRWAIAFVLAPRTWCVLMTGSPLLVLANLSSETIALKPLFATCVVTSLHSSQLFMQFYLEFAGGLKLRVLPLIH